MRHTSYFISSILFFISVIANAQDQKVNASGINQIDIYLDHGDLKVYEIDGDEVVIKKTVVVNDKPAENIYDISTEKVNGKLKISGNLDEDKIKQQKVIYTQDGKRFYMNRNEDYHGEKEVETVSYGYHTDITIQIGIPKSKKLTVESLYGNIRIEQVTAIEDITSTYGSIDIKMNSKPNNAVKFISTYNHVDVSMPVTVKADLKLTTSYGSLFTNFPIQADFSNEFTDTPHGDNLTAALNGGGSQIYIESTYENVYLRKS